MSRIGNKVIILPANVKVEIAGSVAKVTGPKGTEEVIINDGITVNVEGTEIKVSRANNEKQIKQNHGTTRANLHNAVVGVTEGYVKKLEMRGIGFKAQVSGNKITLWAGYSHTVDVIALPGVKMTCTSPTEITVEGTNKQAVGQTAALIREVRRPEPYLGKGIRYVDEYVATKEGKRAGK